MSHRGSGKLSRRQFIHRSSTAGAGLAVTGLLAGNAPAAAAVPRRTLGRTGLKVSEISFGSYGFSNPAVLGRALDAGLNLIDTGPMYQSGNAEKAVGQIMKTRRDDAYIVTKWEVKANSKAADLLASLDASLKRLQTDHVDIIQTFAVDAVGPLNNPELYAAFEKAKQQGKAKFLGFSAHGGNLNTAFARALEINKFGACSLKYNFVENEGLAGLMRQAVAKELGVVAFKCTPPGSVTEPAIKWALSQPGVGSVCVTIKSFEDVKKYASLAGQRLTPEDERTLKRLAAACWQTYCRYCGKCAAACPGDVQVAEVMRYAMYYRDYGHRHDARRLYAELPRRHQARACAGCSGPCTNACPHGLPTRRNLVRAHEMLV
ncbi:MAG: aldo/keto reductase [Armatimonadota bacterium]